VSLSLEDEIIQPVGPDLCQLPRRVVQDVPKLIDVGLVQSECEAVPEADGCHAQAVGLVGHLDLTVVLGLEVHLSIAKSFVGHVDLQRGPSPIEYILSFNVGRYTGTSG